jgi:hypothetical protein
MELHKLQTKLGLERMDRLRDIEERKGELQRANKMDQWRQQRAAVRAEMRAELAGDMGREQEELLLRTLAAREAEYAQLSMERQKREDRAAELQDAFLRVKAATGVATLEDMVDRYEAFPHPPHTAYAHVLN